MLRPKCVSIWDSEVQPKESVNCNLCGGSWTVCTHTYDRYGFYQAARECQQCGLNFLSPRMTREAYARFYETAYRPLVSAFHGREINAQTIEKEQQAYAEELYNILDAWTREWGASRLLDIGGSTGVVAAHLATHMGFVTASVMDPSPAETSAASARGLRVLSGQIETYFDVSTLGTFDLITLCQTADHLLDLMGALKKIRGLLSEDGLFWADIVDFDVTREVKIDHPFNLTEKTFREFLKRAGFQLLQVNYADDGVHIGFLCKASA